MIPPRSSIVLVAVLIGGCASDGSLEGRTVFNNPYAVPVIDRTGIGPQCDVGFGRDATCLGAPLIYTGQGRNASLGNGEIVRLTRAQRRILRERAELIEAQSNQLLTPAPPASPPPQPALPTAASDSDTP